MYGRLLYQTDKGAFCGMSTKNKLLVFCGSICMVLGAIGIFLPILPTTPFLLLSAYCYMRSSRKCYDWLMNNKILGSYIYNYVNYRAILLSTKIYSLITLWIVLSASIAVVSSVYVRALLFIIGICVSIHIYTIRTLTKTDMFEISRIKNLK